MSKIDVTTEPFQYASSSTPKGYRCSECGATGVKLWRENNTFLDFQVLRCVHCACKKAEKPVPTNLMEGDQLGWLIPAVPTEDGTTYWGYTSVPMMGCIWWKRLAGPLRTKQEIETEIAQHQENVKMWNAVKHKYKPGYIEKQLANCDLGLEQALLDLKAMA